MKWILFLILAGAVIFLIFLLYQERSGKYEQAFSLYQKGLAERDTFLRNQAFNQALQQLLEIEGSSSAKDAFIGLLLAHLRQFPLSAYYYLEALSKDPNNQAIQEQLLDAIKMGNIPMKVPQVFFKKSYPNLLALLFVLWIGLLSLWLWKKLPLLKLTVALSAFPLFAYLAYIIYLGYLAPIYGVIIHPQTLYQEAGSDAPPVFPIPFPEGSLVVVLDAAKQGHWLKIRTEDGVMGYVPQDAIRVVH